MVKPSSLPDAPPNDFQLSGLGHTRSCHTGDAVPRCIESSGNRQTTCFCEGDLCNGANSSLSSVGITMLMVAVSRIWSVTWV